MMDVEFADQYDRSRSAVIPVCVDCRGRLSAGVSVDEDALEMVLDFVADDPALDSTPEASRLGEVLRSLNRSLDDTDRGFERLP